MVMVTRNEKPSKKGAQKGDQITAANDTTTCAQFSYYRNNFHPSRRSDRRATGANAGLMCWGLYAGHDY
jgi:hypothetical protein